MAGLQKSADDTALHHGTTKDSAFTWTAEEVLPACKVGRLWKFQHSETDSWVTTQPSSRRARRCKAA